MRTPRIANAMGCIDDDLIVSSENKSEHSIPTQNNSSKQWKKWIAIAACLVLVFAIGFPFVKDLLISTDQKDILDAIILIEYDDSYLEVIEDEKTIQRLGLQERITEEIVGTHIAYLKKAVPEAEHSNYIVSDVETDIELLEYAPAPYKAVRIVREGEKYSYAWFCNYLVDQWESKPICEAFGVYGINGADHIVSITPVGTNNTWKATGERITDAEIILEFFNEISKLPAYSFDEYHEKVFADELKKQEDIGGGDVGSEAYTAVADDSHVVVLETKEGLCFAINYYPSYGWIAVSQTMSYYLMSTEMSRWFTENID